MGQATNKKDPFWTTTDGYMLFLDARSLAERIGQKTQDLDGNIFEIVDARDDEFCLKWICRDPSCAIRQRGNSDQ